MKKYFKIYSLILFLSFMSVLNVYATENPVFRYRISDVNLDQSSSDEGNGKLSISIPVSSRVRTNVQYSLKLGEATTYTNWSIYSGVLPNGLSLNTATGEISGTPLDDITNDYPIQIKVYDSDGNYGVSNTLTLMLLKAPTIYVETPKTYSVGESVSFKVTTTNTYGSKVFTIDSKLPYGIFLDSTTGEISGTTYQGGVFSYKLTVIDSDGATATTNLSNLEIDNGLTISGYVFPVSVRVGKTYTSALPYTNSGVGSGVWSIVDGSLPDGLVVNSSNGQISGTPTTEGTYSFLVQAKYSDNNIAIGGEYTIKVLSSDIKVSVNDLLKREGRIYSGEVSVSNLIGEPTYRLSQGTLDGLSLDSSSGKISGTMGVTGTYNDNIIKVIDGNDGAIGYSNSFNIVSWEKLQIGLPTFPSIKNGKEFTIPAPTAIGVYSSAEWSPAVTLPAGLTMSGDGSITGTISSYGTFTISYQLKDTWDDETVTASQSFVVADENKYVSSLSDFEIPVNEYFSSGSLIASPTDAGVVYSLASGTLPEGLVLNSSTGAITGTPTLAGEYTGFSIKATFSDNGIATTNTFKITVKEPVNNISVSLNTNTYSVYVNQTLSTISPVINGHYSTVVWSLGNGVFPSWLTLDSNTGILSGTADNNVKEYTGLTLFAEIDGKKYETTLFAISVIEKTEEPNISISSPCYSCTAEVGKYFNSGLPNVTGTSSSNIIWSLNSESAFPSWININSTTGEISGTPTEIGEYNNLRINANIDGVNYTSSNFSISVVSINNISISNIADQNILINSNISIIPTVLNYSNPLNFTLTGTLPNGLSFNSSNGSITGTATTKGVFGPFAIIVIDSDTKTATTNNFMITVYENNIPEITLPCTTCNAIINIPTTFGTPTVTDANGAKTWSLVGDYPSWAVINSSTGEISGTPTDIGTYTGLQLKLTVNNIDYLSSSFSIVVTYGPNITISGLSDKTYIVGNTVTTNTPSVDNNVGTYTFSLIGTLPSELSFSETTGIITGTASTVGDYGPYMITVTDSESRSSTSSEFYIHVYNAEPLSVTISGDTSFTEANKTVNIIATTQYARGSVVYELHGDNIPTWLTFDSSTGNISGTTPSESTIINNVYITATDSYGQTSTSNKLNITVSTLSIDGIVDQTVYKNVLFNIGAPSVSSSYGTVTYSSTGGPSWFNVNSTNGSMSGTPTSIGSWLVTYQIKDYIGTKNINFNLISNGLVVNNQIDSQVHVNSSFSINAPSVTGITNSLLIWSVYSGSLPTGLTLDSSTGIISGKPTVSGTYSLNLKVTDSVTGTYSATNMFTIDVLEALNVGNITTYFVGYVQSSFQNTQLKAYNAVGNVTWTVQSGTFPSWLTLNFSTGKITGTPEDTFYSDDIIFRATDSSGAYVDTPKITIAVFNNLVVTTDSQYYTSRVEDNLDITFTYSGVSGDPVWSISSGSMPDGLTFNTSNGEITGTLTKSGYYTFTVSAYHEASEQTVDTNIVVVVSPKLSMVLDQTTYSADIGTYLKTNSPVITGNVGGISYSYTGTLLSDINFDSSTGIFSGVIPTESSLEGKEYLLKLTVKDSFDLARKNVDVTINITSPYEELAISDFSVPSTGLGVAYVFASQPVATGGSGTYTYSISSQTTGSGLSINSSTGIMSGTPTTSGSKTVTVKVVDSDGRSVSVSKTFTVYANLVLTSPVFGTSTALSPVVMTSQPKATGGTGTYTWSLSGNPSWMSIDGSTGIISGTPDTVGNFTTQVIVVSGDQTKTSSVITGTVQIPTLTLATTTFADKLNTDVLFYDFNDYLTTTGIYDQSAIVWSATDLPDGLTINSSNGIVSGTVSTTGTYDFTITGTFALNGVEYVATQNYSITIINNINIFLVSSGGYHTCALTTSGSVKCWGQNTYGQLGNESYIDSNLSVDVTELTFGVTSISSGGYHTCALTTSGGVKCWGNNTYGQIGDGFTTNRATPVDVTGLTSGVTSISSGLQHTCALTTSGGVKCWGRNTYGQIGDGSTTNRATPVDVTGLTSGVTSISSGSYHTCALTTSGGVKCWGQGVNAQLGNGFTTNRTTSVDVTGLTSGVTSISSGGYHTCALTTSGGVKCWGYGISGQLGNGNVTTRSTSVDVTGLTSGVLNISSGIYYTCALTTSGGLKCWGQGTSGQLGNGSTTNRTTPVDVTGLTSGVTSVSSGGYHTCALTTGGGVKCWGNNTYGQIGDGTNTNSDIPVTVSGIQ